jgi:hypothetical protein
MDDVRGKKYLTEQAATMLKFARASTDPDVAAGFVEKAVELTSEIERRPDKSPRAPDVQADS